MLRTAIDNLVSNAIKFSPERGRLRVELCEPRDGVVVVAIEDDGPGVPAEERDAIFESFYQGRATFTHGVRGTGLGLSIAREYVQAHGGEVSMEDGERGARAVIRLEVRA